MEYKLASSYGANWHESHQETLEKSVSELIAQGFEPFGGVAVDRHGCLYQAMIKRGPTNYERASADWLRSQGVVFKDD